MMDLCIICLRPDRQLTLSCEVLAKFHDLLCDFSVSNESTLSCTYCNQCYYLLTKFYKFKQKCVMALKIYRTWLLEEETNKQPINTLCDTFPQSSINIWNLDPKRNGNFTFQAMDLIKYLSSDESKCIIDKSESQLIDNNSCNNLHNNMDIPDENCENILNDDPITNTENQKEPDKQIDHNNKTQTKRKTQTDLKKKTQTKRKNGPDILSEHKNKEIHHDNNLEVKKVKQIRTPKTSKIKESRINNPKKCNTGNGTKNRDEDDNLYETMFDIEYLTNKELVMEEFERRKTYDCYINAEYKCDLCHQPMKSKQYLEYHKERWHTERPGESQCPICKIWCSKADFHRRMKHTVVCKCKLCPLVSYQRKSMKLHLEWHNGKQYHCEPCTLSYRSLSAYSFHMNTTHQKGRHVCVRCGRGFRSAGGLRIHEAGSMRCRSQAAPVPAATVRCEDCDVTLPSLQVYEVHKADVHDCRRRHRRIVKGRTSAGLPKQATMLDEARSKRRDRKGPRLECRLCNKTGGNFSWLKLHFKNEHPTENVDLLYADKKKHLCDICGIGLSSIYGLRDHMNTHTGAKPYACDLCTKTFHSPALCAGHRRRHFPGTHVCSLCGKTCKSVSNLHSHVKSHIGEKNYKCDICGKAFLSSHARTEHVQGVHHNIRRKKNTAGTNRRRIAEVAGTLDDSPSE